MKKLLTLLLVLGALLTSCVPSSVHEEIKRENDSLRQVNEKMVAMLATLMSNQEEPYSGRKYSEQEALDKVRDYYEFYRRDYKYRGPKVRRKGTSPNEFVVSVEELLKSLVEIGGSYDAKVYNLTFDAEGKYKMEPDYNP